jgi:hypothetical protein
MRFSTLATACLCACSRAPSELPASDASPAQPQLAAKVFVESADAERIAAQYAKEHWGRASRASAAHEAAGWHVDLEFDGAMAGAHAFVLLDEKGNVTQAKMY